VSDDGHLPDDPSAGPRDGRVGTTESDRAVPASGDDRVEDATAAGRGTGGEEPGNGFAIAAMVLGVLAVFVAPIILGPIGLILAAVARSRNQPLANWAIGVAAAGTVIGLALAFFAMQAIEGEQMAALLAVVS
jgi:hypothetical protein